MQSSEIIHLHDHESKAYGVTTEMLIQHQAILRHSSFMIFPQLRLLSNPGKSKDRRSDIPDIGFGLLSDAACRRRFSSGRCRAKTCSRDHEGSSLDLPSPSTIRDL